MSWARCTKESAIQSTPMRRAWSRSIRSLAVRAGTGMIAPGMARPLWSDSASPATTLASAQPSPAAVTVRRTRPSSSSRSVPGLRTFRTSGCGRQTRRASPGAGSESSRIRSPLATATLPLEKAPRRNFGPCRSASAASGRPSASSAARTASSALVWSAWAPWLKFRRKTSTPATAHFITISGDRVAGPRVATMRVRRRRIISIARRPYRRAAVAWSIRALAASSTAAVRPMNCDASAQRRLSIASRTPGSVLEP